MQTEAIQAAAQLITYAEHITALTGAGFSTPSGIPDFRSHDSGLWKHNDPMEVASITGFKYHPEKFYRWIRPLAAALIRAQPNPAHDALVKLETIGKLKSIVTQNIDMLHSRAGSTRVHEVHGHLREVTCITCFSVFPAQHMIEEFLQDNSISVLCCPKCGGILKPNVILFGEQLPAMVLNAAQREAKTCDLMIVAGTSLEVYPVADLPRLALGRGAKLMLINQEPTAYDRHAHVVIHGDVADILPQIVNAVEATAR